MNSISALQALSPSETWQAWLQAAEAPAEAVAPGESAQTPEAPLPTATVSPTARSEASPVAAVPLPVEPASAVQPLAPALLSALSLQDGPELRWRPQDGRAWRELFEDCPDDNETPANDTTAELADDAQDLSPPPWAQALLARLQQAARAPASAAALRPALQAWRAGAPVLLASPAGLACLQTRRDAELWSWRRWPARWRSARPATGPNAAERWWAVRLGLGPQGRPRTLRELAGTRELAPGLVSCELRLDGMPPGLAQWSEVLVQAPAQPSLRLLLASRPSLPWLLCNQALWP